MVSPSHRLQSEEGSIIVAILVALAITMGFLGFHYSEKMALQKLDKSRVIVGSSIKTHIASLHSIMTSQKSLIKTLKTPLNGDLWRCINDVEYDCPQTSPTPMTIISELGDDSNPYSSPAASSGLDLNMNTCGSYPSLTCPFRYELVWYAECVVGGPCFSPDVYVEGKLVVAPSVVGVLNLNTANYNLLMKIR